MSIVGPRPLPIEYLDRYDNTQARRLEARPGVTGWAQVNGRNLVPWTERFELDVWYVDHASTRLDLRILRATIRQVIRREGIDQGDGTTMTEFTGTS
jgi:lipopolysaccharide/colanic/teichoic acid biosynthesis glycosyltransferase